MNIESYSHKILKFTENKEFLDAYALLLRGISEAKENNDIVKLNALLKLINGVSFLLGVENGRKKEENKPIEKACQFCFKERERNDLLLGSNTSICKECAAIAIEELSKNA